MPKPVYIICATGVIEDKQTNLVTIFQAIETVSMTHSDDPKRLAVNEIPAEFGQMTVLSVWMKQDDDEAVSFEHQFVLHCDELDDVTIESDPFTFGDNAYLHRFKMTFRGIPPLQSSGMLAIISRIRKVGDTDWIDSQKYPIRAVVTRHKVTPNPQIEAESTAKVE